MLDPDEIAELKAQRRIERRQQRASALDPRDPDYDGPDPDADPEFA